MRPQEWFTQVRLPLFWPMYSSVGAYVNDWGQPVGIVGLLRSIPALYSFFPFASAGTSSQGPVQAGRSISTVQRGSDRKTHRISCRSEPHASTCYRNNCKLR